MISMEAMEADDAERCTSADAKLHIYGHGSLVSALLVHLLQLEHSELNDRRAALVAIASHLGLTREAKATRDLLELLKVRLWKELDSLLLQNLVKVLVDVALCPSHVGSCVAGVQVRDGLGWSTSSPLKRKSKDSREDDVNVKVAVARSVAHLLLEYLVVNDQVELGLLLQLLHSLLKIGEKTDGIVTWESLGFAVRRHLRSSNPRVRALVLRLLVASVQEKSFEVEPENAKRRCVGDFGEVQGSADLEVKSGCGFFSPERLKVGEVLLLLLVNYMKDPFPSVRETALRAVMKLHAKGYVLTSESCKIATTLFGDSFAYVRIAAIEMVGLFMRRHLGVKDQLSLKQCTEGFLQVCTAVTDMNMRVREAAFRVLGEATMIPNSVLVQTLTKKVARAPRETDVSVCILSAAQHGETVSIKVEEGGTGFDATAAGAFVHGLEDEYLEVRCAAMEALAKLACNCERMVFGAANLLLHMLNEEVEIVRMQAIHALSQMATAGYLSVHDQHLHLFLSVVEDINPDVRTVGRNLLASSVLPSFSTLHSIVQTLLTSLEHHPEDEKGVISTFSVLGQTHPTYTECITQELLQEMQGHFSKEVGLDEPRFAAILSLFLGAGLLNSNIVSLIPARVLSYSSFIRHKLPDLIKSRPVFLKSAEFSWSNSEKRQLRATSNPVAR